MFVEPLADFSKRVGEFEQLLEANPRALAIFRKAISQVRPDEVAALQEKYHADLVDFDQNGQFKYADLPYWINHKLTRAIELDLDRRDKLSILDIGTGAGHFPLICKALGHDVIGIDIDEPLYIDICNLFGIERQYSPVKRRVRLPDFGRKFDVVTAFWISFDSMYFANRERIWWGTDDWAFLLQDLIDRQLNFPAQIRFELNKQKYEDIGLAFDLHFLEWMFRKGATVDYETGIFTFSPTPTTRVYPTLVSDLVT
jgi:hypothetical protein